MSRSYHQRHKVFRNSKHPRKILKVILKDNKSVLIERKIKMKPYGRKDFIGWGEETYSRRICEYFITRTNKTSYRMKEKLKLKLEINTLD